LSLGLHPVKHQPEALQRSYIKKTTALYYKQSKFNLLRESSEGFSALIVLLTSSTALTPGSTSEAGEETRTRANIVWSRVMGLIGYFNLSPPRVLDLVLEVAGCHVLLHWRFFLELLRSSPWGKNARASDYGGGKGKQRAKSVEEELQELERGLDTNGDRVLGQVLGAKFGFAQVSPQSSIMIELIQEEQKPDGGDTQQGMVMFAALLVKYRFVGLSDLLPFVRRLSFRVLRSTSSLTLECISAVT
jgi:THO complex subunit 2